MQSHTSNIHCNIAYHIIMYYISSHRHQLCLIQDYELTRAHALSYMHSIQSISCLYHVYIMHQSECNILVWWLRVLMLAIFASPILYIGHSYSVHYSVYCSSVPSTVNISSSTELSRLQYIVGLQYIFSTPSVHIEPSVYQVPWAVLTSVSSPRLAASMRAAPKLLASVGCPCTSQIATQWNSISSWYPRYF